MQNTFSEGKKESDELKIKVSRQFFCEVIKCYQNARCQSIEIRLDLFINPKISKSIKIQYTMIYDFSGNAFWNERFIINLGCLLKLMLIDDRWERTDQKSKSSSFCTHINICSAQTFCLNSVEKFEKVPSFLVILPYSILTMNRHWVKIGNRKTPLIFDKK